MNQAPTSHGIPECRVGGAMAAAVGLGSIAIVMLLTLACATPADTPMTRERLEALILASAQDIAGRAGALEFSYDGVSMACISDVSHDRMRIIAPIAAVGGLSARTLEVLLVANYHTSLDARYAISEGTVYAAYLHPLSDLTEAQLASALRQVSSLAKTFGSTFSSGELSFGSPGGRAL